MTDAFLACPTSNAAQARIYFASTNLHAGKPSELLENSELSRITDAEMKKPMIEASEKVAALLVMKEKEPAKYWRLIADYTETYCKNWEK